MFITDNNGTTTVQPDPQTGNAGAADSDMPDELVLKKVTYQDTNGNAQTIYVQQGQAAGDVQKQVHFHLSTAFLALGVISFGLGIYFALKKFKNE